MRPRTVVFALAIALASCGRGYSDGDRVGVVTKFSRRGLLWKSWEGEMAMGGIRTRATDHGVVAEANVWRFTVLDEGVAKQLSDALGAASPVRIHYTQWLAHGCTRDTSYEVLSVEAVR